MSEYHCYEFVALERALAPKDVVQLRGISRRAELSRTHCWLEQYGRGSQVDPDKLVERHFDAALCFSSSPRLRLWLRLPLDQGELARLKPYFPGGPASLRVAAEHIVLQLDREFDQDRDGFFARGQLSKLLPLRAALLAGDLSFAYLAWLLAAQSGALSGSRREPPVPPELRQLSPALVALADLFEVDRELLAAAAERSPELAPEPAAMRRWIRSLSERDKERWLLRALEPQGAHLGRDLRRAFVLAQQGGAGQRRTVAALLAQAASPAAAPGPAAASTESGPTDVSVERAGGDASEVDKLARAARKRRLAALRRQGDKAWSRLARLIAARRYDEAVTLAADLRDAASDETMADFQRNLAVVRRRHSRRHGFLRLAGAPTQ